MDRNNSFGFGCNGLLIASVFIFKVSGKTSTNIGFAPVRSIALAVAIESDIWNYYFVSISNTHGL